MALTSRLGISNGIVVVDCNSEKLFSYVVARDYGFAPNPFYGMCTLATCKPGIRREASIGNWVVGTGSKAKDRKRCLVYVMRVTETMTFNEYWENERFRCKRPNLRGSLKQAFGDNIYFHDDTGQWNQQNSHHSYSDGKPNPYNIDNDTKTDRVLLSTKYVYWGGSGPEIPQRFSDYDGSDICALRNYKCHFPEKLVTDFLKWFHSIDATGYVSAPLDWPKTP